MPLLFEKLSNIHMSYRNFLKVNIFYYETQEEIIPFSNYLYPHFILLNRISTCYIMPDIKSEKSNL